MEATGSNGLDQAAERLASEMADVEASISLVADGAVSSMTLTQMRFGQQLAGHFGPIADRMHVRLETSFVDEGSTCDIHVFRAREADRG